MASTAEIMVAMRDALADWMSERGYGASVYVVEEPIDETTGQFAIQIVPGSESAVHPNSGVGLIRSNFDLVVWWRGMLDPMARATERISGDEGIQQFTSNLREFMVQRKFDGMVIPILFRSGGTVKAVDGLDGWSTLTDSYDFGYEMTWEVKT
jgi:hypothetical protein